MRKIAFDPRNTGWLPARSLYYLSPDALNPRHRIAEPLFKKADPAVDDAGIEYSTDGSQVQLGGLALIVGYNVIRRGILPRMDAAAREKAEEDGARKGDGGEN